VLIAFRLIAASCLGLLAVPVSGQDAYFLEPLRSEPLWVENLSPLAGLVALPSQRSARITPGLTIALHGAVANHWVSQDEAEESVFFDGETGRVTAAFEYGFSDANSFRLSVPWVSHSQGSLDGLINDWHALFGMSDGGRSHYPEDNFQYRYRRDEGEALLVQSASGLGDVRAEWNTALLQADSYAVSASVGYKFSTGDDPVWLGSGAGDVFTSLRFSGRHLSDLPLVWHGQLGYTYAGQSELLGAAQRRNLWRAGLSVDWQLGQHWSLLAQLDGHAGVVDSALGAIGNGPSVLLSLGTRYRLTSSWLVDVSFVEDIRVETAPDITFQATLRWQP